MLGYERCGSCNRWIDMPNETHHWCDSCQSRTCNKCAGGIGADDYLAECPRCKAENAKDAEVARLMQEGHAQAMNAILGVVLK